MISPEHSTPDKMVIYWNRGTRVAVLSVGSPAPSSFVDDLSGERWWGTGEGWEGRRAQSFRQRREFYTERPLRTPVSVGRRRAA